MDKKPDAYFKTDKSINAQLTVEKDMVEYHKNMFSFLGIDVERVRNKTYLDIGCARGSMMQYFQRAGFDVYGCDVSEWAVEECKKRFEPERVLLADISRDKPFDKKFGIITCFGVLGLVDMERQENVIRNCFEMLDRGGIFISTVPNNDRPRIIRKVVRREHSYGRARNKGEWLAMLEKFGWGEARAETIQRIPLSKKLSGKNVFVKTRFGDPIVLIGKKS